MERSERAMLKVGSLYKLHDREGLVLEVFRLVPDQYSEYTAMVRSTITGWTMIVHGTNMYEDGSIDWDFSTGGHWTDKDENGNLVEMEVWHQKAKVALSSVYGSCVREDD